MRTSAPVSARLVKMSVKASAVLVSFGLLAAGMVAVAAPASAYANPAPVALGAFGKFSLLAGSGIQLNGNTQTGGDFGTSTGFIVPSFGSSITSTFGVERDNEATLAAEQDMRAAVAVVTALTPDTTLTQAGIDTPEGSTIQRGVYLFSGAVQIRNDLTLDAQGDPNAVFIFKTDGALSTLLGTKIILKNGAQAGNVFWRVDGATSIGADSTFSGTVLGMAATTLGAGSVMNGKLSGFGPMTLLGGTGTTSLAPQAPTAVVATVGAAQSSVSWTAPTNNGNMAINRYIVTASTGQVLNTTGATSLVFTGLANNVSVSFTVRAQNGMGTSSASAPSNAVLPFAAPSAPASVTAVAGNANAVISWAASTPGGSPTTGYTVTASPGGQTVTSPSLTGTITGLTNTTPYTFTVRANTAFGQGPASSPSNSVIPVGEPLPPTAVVGTRGDGQATISWTANINDGGTPITGYKITSSGGQTLTTSGGGLSALITGLTNGTSYTFSVSSINAIGTSLTTSTSSNAVIPVAFPSAPSAVVAIVGNGQATVTWSAPASNGGEVINGYTVTASNGQTAITNGATNATVLGLPNGFAYTFTVVARNTSGESLASPASNSIVNPVVSGVPTNVNVFPGDARVTVSWMAPNYTGGVPIQGYLITASPGGQTVTTAGALSVDFGNLINGTSYTFTVRAINVAGDSLPSFVSPAVIPIIVPNQPTNVSAVQGNQQATVSWTAPLSNGGPAVTGYTVTSSLGQVATTTGATTVVITGLTNGVAYTFTVVAINSVGTSLPSAPSNPVTEGAVPGVPTDVIAVPDNGQALVSWTAPVSNGGSPIIAYTVTASTGLTVTTGGATSVMFPGLINGPFYTFTVTASTVAGTSVSSLPSAAIRTAAVPGAPTGLSGSAGDRQVSLFWTAPANIGGSAITGYTVTSSTGQTATTAGVTSAIVSGLTNGTPYSFTVVATNAIGDSIASATSAVFRPSILPGAPTGVTATAGNGEVSILWSAPLNNGGSPILSYSVMSSLGQVVTSNGITAAVMTGLVNGTDYSFTVTATTLVGTSTVSIPSNIVTPIVPLIPIVVTTPPSIVPFVSATASDGQVLIQWSAPTSNGGTPILGYTVTAVSGQTVNTLNATSVVMTGLTNGTVYTFTVSSTNAAGTSVQSAESNAVVPTSGVAAPVPVAPPVVVLPPAPSAPAPSAPAPSAPAPSAPAPSAPQFTFVPAPSQPIPAPNVNVYITMPTPAAAIIPLEIVGAYVTPDIPSAKVIISGKIVKRQIVWTIVKGVGLRAPAKALFTVFVSPVKKQQVKRNILAATSYATNLSNTLGGVLYQEGKPFQDNALRGVVPRIVINW